MKPIVKEMIKRKDEIVKRKQSELEYELLCERANFINLMYGGRTVNDRILKKAETLSLKYETQKDQIAFLAGFVEGYKHLKGVGSGEAYENGRTYGLREFQGEANRREERFFRENSKPHLRRVK
ncbi:hypothetical protein FH584_17970 [Leptospira interrogans]|uniref:hypothetical protein n=1 Tax=Leptospira interrogans TaxID=173 RepID=UPI001EF08A48|nr:hypothetical protein [Leptospira interrogans]ULG94373.1 hypothetical protein FH584_17970 [Leptospira interrogans]